LKVNLVFAEGNQLFLRFQFFLTLACLLTKILLFWLSDIHLVDLAEDKVTIASHRGIDKAHMSIDLCVYEDRLVNVGLKFFLFLLTQNFDKSLVFENDFKWDLVVALSLR